MPEQFKKGFFKENFNTSLTPDEEEAFQKWVQQVSKEQGYDKTLDMEDYDLKGFWKSGAAFGSNMHGTDRFKKPNHPTFSVESMYSGSLRPDGKGKFVGGEWGDGYYRPSREMLETTSDPVRLKSYFDKYEPGYELVLPK